MNIKLKLRIIEKYGNQYKFAGAVGTQESIVSKVINNKITLSADKKEKWTEALDSSVTELFPKGK